MDIRTDGKFFCISELDHLPVMSHRRQLSKVLLVDFSLLIVRIVGVPFITVREGACQQFLKAFVLMLLLLKPCAASSSKIGKSEV